MQTHFSLSLLLFSALLAPAAQASSNKPPQSQKAHVHGAVKLGIAIDGNQAELELDAPGEAIFGFEHAARSAEQQAMISKALGLLRTEPTTLFRFPSSAACNFVTSDVQATQEKAAPKTVKNQDAATKDHHHKHDHADHDDHADVSGRWSVVCKTALTGAKLQLQIFKNFNRIKSLEIALVSGTRQTGKTLTKDETLDL